MKKIRRILEHAALGAIVDALLNEGFRVEISDQDGGGTFVYAYPDNSPCRGEASHWVRFSYSGDPCECLADYTINLEDVLAPVRELLKSFE